MFAFFQPTFWTSSQRTRSCCKACRCVHLKNGETRRYLRKILTRYTELEVITTAHKNRRSVVMYVWFYITAGSLKTAIGAFLCSANGVFTSRIGVYDKTLNQESSKSQCATNYDQVRWDDMRLTPVVSTDSWKELFARGCSSINESGRCGFNCRGCMPLQTIPNNPALWSNFWWNAPRSSFSLWHDW